MTFDDDTSVTRGKRAVRSEQKKNQSEISGYLTDKKNGQEQLRKYFLLKYAFEEIKDRVILGEFYLEMV